ncbi:MAG: NAD(P)H-hydrate dehydratase [Alphaproteobacteria bacterium]
MVAEIGIPAAVLHGVGPRTWRNGGWLWGRHRPALRADGHKFDRGQVGVVGGTEMTGAARLAGRAALHAGAGLVTVLSPPERAATYRNDLAGLIVREAAGPEAIAAWFDEPRRKTAVVGPGLGRDAAARATVSAVLAAGCATVVDADGLSCFAGAAPAFAGLVRADCVVTPHEGEYARLFGDRPGAGKLDRAREAAAFLGAVVVLKGPDTVIAAPDGRAAINADAPAALAVAGSGDVLSGIVGAAMATGLPAFEAAALAVSCHSRAGHAMTRSSADALADAVAPLWEMPRGAG